MENYTLLPCCCALLRDMRLSIAKPLSLNLICASNQYNIWHKKLNRNKNRDKTFQYPVQGFKSLWRVTPFSLSQQNFNFFLAVIVLYYGISDILSLTAKSKPQYVPRIIHNIKNAIKENYWNSFRERVLRSVKNSSLACSITVLSTVIIQRGNSGISTAEIESRYVPQIKTNRTA